VDEDPLTVSFTPLEVRCSGRSYWLVWLEPNTPDVEAFRAQSLMAQRVAHDLKNPLTSILLTLQRMQMATRQVRGRCSLETGTCGLPSVTMTVAKPLSRG